MRHAGSRNSPSAAGGLTGVTLRSTVAFPLIGALGNGPMTRSRMPCVWPRSAATAERRHAETPFWIRWSRVGAMSGVRIPECWIGVRGSSIRLSSTPLSARLRCRSVYWPFHPDAVGVQSDCSQLVADLRTDKSRTSQLTSIQRGTRRQEAMMSDSSTVRSMSHVVVHSSRRRGERSTRPRDGKIKAAGCGSVGRRKS